MDFYMYKLTCPRWYGIENDIRHIVVSKETNEDEVKEQAKQTANTNIQLIQKYHMIIQPKKSYAALTHLTFDGQNAPYALVEKNNDA